MLPALELALVPTLVVTQVPPQVLKYVAATNVNACEVGEGEGGGDDADSRSSSGQLMASVDGAMSTCFA